MIIVLKPHTSDESIKKIEDVIRSKGAVPHVSKGDIQTIIGMVGDTTQIDPKIIEVFIKFIQILYIHQFRTDWQSCCLLCCY